MRTITANGATFKVFDRGAGPTVLFVHGFPLNHSMWNAQLERLAVNNRLIAPDLRGFGGSSVTAGTMTMEQYADDLSALLDAMAVRQRVCLCGLSMGGYVAFAFWRKYAERVRSFVLCDTRAEADSREAAAARYKMIEEIDHEGAEAVARAMLPKLLHRDTKRKHPLIAEQVRAMILGNDPQGIAAALRGMAERPDATDLLASIDVRTLVLAGEQDEITPSAGMRQLAERIGEAQFVSIAEAGHLAPLENPNAVNHALAAFLADELHAR